MIIVIRSVLQRKRRAMTANILKCHDGEDGDETQRRFETGRYEEEIVKDSCVENS